MNHINIAITAAFMWEGVKEDDALLEHWGQGCIELCSEVTQFAELSRRTTATATTCSPSLSTTPTALKESGNSSSRATF